MKDKKYIKKSLKWFFLSIVTVFSLTSCESEFSGETSVFGGSSLPPIITSVNEASEDIPVTQGVLENTYIIRGENLSGLTAIYFNGTQAGFNAAYLTDNIAFVTVPEEAPYVGQSNIMRLETLGGAINYDFSLLTIEEFTEEFIDGVKVVNLIGGDFTDTESVTFVSGTEEDGNLVEREANIVSISEDVVVAEVPAGVEQAFIYLATTRGAVVQSDSYGFSYSIYIDELNPDWTLGGWGGTFDAASTEQALGTYSVKSIREGWSGLTYTNDTGIDLNDYQFVTVQLYGTGAPGDMVNLAFNDFEVSVQLELIPGQWTKYVIPISDWYPGGAPSSITRLDFQEASNTGLVEYIFYVDDFGLI
ncbi:hypothetical protein [Urechidicola croceus]|uniref:IPT/TIG domain-containing protein n=1 Tax=Urechidicola croceus TaxID=1850246 RepID=A0A1D8PAE7_9FLAO|nr:hypothetical protein [Urechidicola croceus]AOW21559.1 hypothetical protein LPB138_13120 [Urechidicola croceus]